MTITDTDTWKTNPCGCRLQLSIWSLSKSDESDEEEPMNMWVIREECPEHAERTRVMKPWLDKWERGETEYVVEGEEEVVVFTGECPNSKPMSQCGIYEGNENCEWCPPKQ